MSKIKRTLTDREVKQALVLIERRISFKGIAKLFNINKSSLLKSVGAWDTEVKKAEDGNKFRIRRGKVEIISTPNKKNV